MRGRVNLFVHDARQAALLIRQRPTHHVLHGAVSRSDDAFLRQEVHQLPEDIRGLTADRRHLTGTRLQLPLHRGIGIPILVKGKNQALVFEARAFGNLWVGVIEIGEVSLPNVRSVLSHIPKAEEEKHAAGLEIAQLQDKERSGFEGVQLSERFLFLGRQGEIFITLFLREPGTSIDGIDFSVAKDDQALAGIVHHLPPCRKTPKFCDTLYGC